MPLFWKERIDQVLTFFQDEFRDDGPVYSYAADEEKRIHWAQYTLNIPDLGGIVHLNAPTLFDSDTNEMIPSVRMFLDDFFSLLYSRKLDDEAWVSGFTRYNVDRGISSRPVYNKYCDWILLLCFFSKACGISIKETIACIHSWDAVKR